MAPYYDHIEKLIGVSGISEGVHNSPCGQFLLPGFRPRCGEWLIKRGAEKLGMKVLPLQLAVLSQNYDGRPACHYCGACNNGCDSASRFSSPDVLVPKLQPLKNFTLQTHAVVHNVLMDKNTGKARGVTYIDANNRQEYKAYGKTVVLGASMVESLRILFNSRSRDYPSGLANSSGVLGKYLSEHVAFNSIGGFMPQLAGRPTTNDDGPGEGSLYIPRYNYGHTDGKKYLRGWRLYFHSGCGAGPGAGASLPGFGSAYKKRIKDLYPANVSISAMGEGLAFPWNYLEIDPDGLKDRYGIPQVRFHTTGEYDHAFAMRDEIYGEMERVLKASGAEILPYKKVAPYPLGSVTHEAGGARMGDDPKTSVLDAWNRCHDIKNLLVVDAACFTSHPEKHPTLTIMALAYRAADHLGEEIRTGNV
jgi:choline dehydrogenase-like flavoprotein